MAASRGEVRPFSVFEAEHPRLPSEPAPAPPSQTRVILQVLLVIVGVASGLWALHRLASVVLVLILATLFAYVIAPLVQLATRPMRIAGRRRGLPRAGAIALVYVLIAGTLATGAALLLPSATQQFDDMIARAPTYAQSILTWEHGWSRYYERLRIPLELRQTHRSLRADGRRRGSRVCAGIAADICRGVRVSAVARVDPDSRILSLERRGELPARHRHRPAAPHPAARSPIIRVN